MSKPKGDYSRSKHFVIAETIGVPHPYCITPRHIAEASDNWSGSLGESAIRAAEDKGVRCGMKGCQLKFDEHEQALIVHCYAPLKDESGKMNTELHTMLLNNKAECEKQGYAGFAFVDKQGEADAPKLDSDPG